MTVPYSVCCKAHRKRLVHSSGGEKQSTTSRISPYASFFLRALQQNRAQARLLYLLNVARARLTFFSRGASMVKFLVITTWPCNHSITYAVSRRQKVPVE